MRILGSICLDIVSQASVMLVRLKIFLPLQSAAWLPDTLPTSDRSPRLLLVNISLITWIF